MSRVNPACLKFKIQGSEIDHASIQRGSKGLNRAWHKLNSSDFSDQSARQAILGMIDPVANPYLANYLLISLRSIHDLTDLSLSLQPKSYLDHTDGVVQEIALHRIASHSGAPGMLALGQVYGYIPEKFQGLFQAVLQNRYHSNFAWLNHINNFTRELLTDISSRLCTQYPNTSPAKQRQLESALVALAIAKGQITFYQIHEIISQTSTELAARIEADRQTMIGGRYAYHFVRQESIESIAEKGLSAQFAPPGSEQPEAIFFNNQHYAGVEYVILGITGFYVKDFLLRIPLDAAPFHAGYRAPDQNLGDYTGDYILDKKHVVPPEKIEVVNPQIALRAVPLIQV